jgi:hypothetical protein
MQPEAIARLSANIRGRVIDPESNEYEVARTVYNGPRHTGKRYIPTRWVELISIL